MRSQSLVQVEYWNDVATVTICRSASLNSLNPAVVYQLRWVMQQVIADPNVQGIVLAGEGKAFVVGSDLGFFLRCIESGDLDRLVKFTMSGHQLMNMMEQCPKPVVARVQGAALGAGTELALACNRVVASPQASFGFPETGMGIYPGLGGTQRAPRTIGIPLAKWLIFAGPTLSAQRAQAVGLVDRVVPAADLEQAAYESARDPTPTATRPAKTAELDEIERFFTHLRIDDLLSGTIDTSGSDRLARIVREMERKSPLALRLAEQFIDQSAEQPLAAGLQREIDHIGQIFSTRDARHGLTFRAGRRLGYPEFGGRAH